MFSVGRQTSTLVCAVSVLSISFLGSVNGAAASSDEALRLEVQSSLLETDVRASLLTGARQGVPPSLRGEDGPARALIAAVRRSREAAKAFLGAHANAGARRVARSFIPIHSPASPVFSDPQRTVSRLDIAPRKNSDAPVVEGVHEATEPGREGRAVILPSEEIDGPRLAPPLPRSRRRAPGWLRGGRDQESIP